MGYLVFAALPGDTKQVEKRNKQNYWYSFDSCNVCNYKEGFGNVQDDV